MTGLRSLAGRIAKLAGRNRSLALPRSSWGTKGFEFWTFLSLLLGESGCKRLLELGSGRSTITLAEYAKSRSARFLSIETSREWLDKARFELGCIGIAEERVRLLEADPESGWYDLEAFRAVVGVESPFDFALIDGPSELREKDGSPVWVRTGEVALREIRAVLLGAELVVVDDVHRRHILESVDRMLDDPGQYARHYYDYGVLASHRNTLCVCARRGSPADLAVARIRELLGLPLYSTLDGAGCPEE